MKKVISTVIFIFAIVLVIRLFCGVYVHDEFTEKHFFIKHRPTLKWTFYSPTRMSDTKFKELSKEEQTEQKYFNEFVRDQGLSR
ncbi:hypothetical protein SAMN05444397_104269 [Flavobacterium aquidurense]|uniref:Uncharacterized protein n=1 Tax=Flavobacterium frigidimaris TaxID=262320 RepID=A0ABX4BLP9_FLAFR|nr:hypothetical protein [Flavobacterium frigidimaris]OXA77100.1 hypothetical protein B0A65_17520 [Flavobacterium frigidimaris]SDZ23242.1 hypothetical protein SAMN05444397_104269 [Flavobacterium aquidurense]